MLDNGRLLIDVGVDFIVIVLVFYGVSDICVVVVDMVVFFIV